MFSRLFVMCSVLVFSYSALAAKKTTQAIHIYGDTMLQVEQKVSAELGKMKEGDYYYKTMGKKCDKANPYQVYFKEAGASYSVGSNGALVASRPLAVIKFTCINYSKKD